MRHYLIVMANLLALAGCTSSPSPVQPPAVLEPVQNALKVQRIAKYKLTEGAGEHYLQLRPVLHEGILYVTDRYGRTLAWDTENKREIWQRDLAAPVASNPRLHENTLLLGTSDGRMIALDAANGERKWSAQLASEVLAAPAVNEGVVVVRCVNGQLYGLNFADGGRRWVTEQRTPALTLRGTSAPVIIGDLVLAAYDNGMLVASNLQSGKELWQATIAVPRGRTDIERMVDIDATPVVVDDVVYSVAFQGRLAAVQLGSGRIIWTRDIDSYTGMSVDAYRVYLGDTQGQVWALDRNTGATLWRQDALLRRTLTRPVIQGQHVVVGDFNGFVHWLERDTGKLTTRVRMQVFDYASPSLDETEDLLFPKSENILAPPVVQQNTLLVMNRYGVIEIYEISAR